MTTAELRRAKELSAAVRSLSMGRKGVSPTKQRPKSLAQQVAELSRLREAPKPTIVNKKVYLGRTGDKGDTPIKGKDYFTEEEKEAFKKSILSRIKLPEVVHGLTPIKGVDYFTESDIQAILKLLTHEETDESEEKEPEITDEMVMAIVRKMERLPENKKLAVQGISNHQSFTYKGTKYGVEELMHGGSTGTSSFAGSQEQSTTAPDGIVTTFPFNHTPTLIYWNGSFQALNQDYTVSNLTITFTGSVPVPQTGDKIINVYA